MKAARESSTPPATVAGPVLEARGITRRFGGLVAVEDVSLAIHPGEIVGLIGPNGAGKSTLFDVLAGEREPSAGEVLLRGRRVEREPAERRLASGLGRTFQIPRPFAALSLVEP